VFWREVPVITDSWIKRNCDGFNPAFSNSDYKFE
jgi:hypothetical protein